MTQVVSVKILPARWLLLALALAVPLCAPAKTDHKMDAREQFERAVRMRTVLEGTPQKDRSLVDYRAAVSAYHKVYLISAQAEEVTPSLIAEAELYEEMGRLFDAKYFQSAIDSYNFLLKQYPGSRYRQQALYSIGLVQKDGLHQPDVAEATLKDYIKRYPKSDLASDARVALNDIADTREKAQAEAKAQALAQAQRRRRRLQLRPRFRRPRRQMLCRNSMGKWWSSARATKRLRACETSKRGTRRIRLALS